MVKEDPFERWMKKIFEEMMNDLQRIHEDLIKNLDKEPVHFSFRIHTEPRKDGISIKLTPTKDGFFVDRAKKVKDTPFKEPFVDVIEDGKTGNILMDIPGIQKDHITVKSNGKEVVIRVEHPEIRYSKRVVFQHKYNKKSLSWDYKNGILHIQLTK
jgi:HSP20 family molecular chaperone IbpA